MIDFLNILLAKRVPCNVSLKEAVQVLEDHKVLIVS